MQGFVFRADGHLDSRGCREDISGYDGFNALKQAVDIANSLGVDLIDGGDLFDKNRPTADVVNSAVSIIKGLKGTFYFVQGNHDKNHIEPWMHLLGDKACHLHGVMKVIGGMPVSGIDYNPTSVFSEILAKTPATDVIVCHQALKQSLGFDGAWNADLDWFKGKARLVCIGDIHKAQVVGTDVKAIYPGVQWMRTIDDNPDAQVVVVEKKADGSVEAKHVPLGKHRAVIRVPLIDSDEQLAAVLADDSLLQSLDPQQYADLPNAMRSPIVCLRYYADVDGVAPAFKALLDGFGGGHLVESVLPARGNTRMVAAAANVGDKPVTLSDLIAKSITDDNVKSLSLELAACQDVDGVRAVIAAWRDRFKAA